MKLYYSKGACSLAVRIIINELGLTCEYESVDLKKKQTATEKDFLQINPKGAVPTLVTNEGEILTENSVIQQYLADTHHATELLPAMGDFKRYRVLEGLNFVATEIHKGFSPFFNPHISQELKDNLFTSNIKAKLNVVEQQLKKNKYWTGDQFTLPDAYLFITLLWAVKLKFDINEWPDIAKYFANLQQRKSIQQSLQEEELINTPVQN